MAKLVKGVNDLASQRPDLVEEWNYEKNGNLTPEDVSCGSHKRVWWIMPYDDPKTGRHFDFEWEARIDSRVRGCGCPYLNGQKVFPTFNDLASCYPEISAMWHPTKNGDLKPIDVACHTNRKVWWFLPYDDPATGKHFDFEWEAEIYKMVRSSGCPYLAPANAAVWPGFNDLASRNEVVASQWDYEKNGNLKPEDFTCMSTKKVWWICEKGHEWKTAIYNRSLGYGCPECYREKGHLHLGENDLASQKPMLIKEWHPTKNENLTPADVCCYSHRRVWWVCEEGHEWEASIESRACGGKCPYCHPGSGRFLPGFSDLSSQKPLIASQWHPTKNGDLTPDQIPCYSPMTAWWRCEKGHEWEARISSRTYYDQKCPYCAGKRVLPHFNDIATTHPRIASQWHPTKNGDLTPEDVSHGSNQKVWWLGECGHEWEAKVSQRTAGGECPECKATAGEQCVAEVLNRIDFPYLYDKPLDGCRDKGLLRHDFILLSERRVIATIEFHGPQHYVPTRFRS